MAQAIVTSYNHIFGKFQDIFLNDVGTEPLSSCKHVPYCWASEANPTPGCSIEISCDWASEASPTLGC